MNTPSRESSGTLWIRHRAPNRCMHLACGALRRIQTRLVTIEDGGVAVPDPASVRASNARSSTRNNARRNRQAIAQPILFLPCEPDLFVADFTSDTHLVLLNKFNVIDHHLLIRDAPLRGCRKTLLNPADFRALFDCITQFESLGFY